MIRGNAQMAKKARREINLQYMIEVMLKWQIKKQNLVIMVIVDFYCVIYLFIFSPAHCCTREKNNSFSTNLSVFFCACVQRENLHAYK